MADISVVIRSKDEADRLRLTLISLSAQTIPIEIVVVNDGSSDHTNEVIDAAQEHLSLVRVDNPRPRGRSGAANDGAAAASGSLLLFLDGDTLAAPDWAERHLKLWHAHPFSIGRGETFHLRCTRAFLDPESGSPKPGEELKVARLSERERQRQLVKQEDILNRFNTIEARGQPGIYPGAGPRRLNELETDLLRMCPESSVAWAAASGANQSVPRAAFLDVGGFDELMTINEHRELALRLCQAGLRMRFVEGARTYHMIHRSGWRDPSEEPVWQNRFYERHPIAAVALTEVFWQSLAVPSPIPPLARILSLPALEAAATRCAGLHGIDVVRAAHFQFSHGQAA